ncbi:uncharacterized protein FA14DRAFT_182433 [Meira miltonrushii]|uniref:Uncharacterized protein n=1 Tax=Meira miltonrushii TaxID=1280837 RepID=A0A316V2F4_9BASI|nr:uncharacterized protein FA14DRAFT_182433 [Meira miltonrushii]PWN31642.1 hypothetical protein FA14DRAFT_182433 [Meira miltonrushii]
MTQEDFFDIGPPPIPVNGFPDDDDDEDPMSPTEYAQASKEHITESLPQEKSSTSGITENNNEQRPLIDRVSSPRSYRGMKAYKRAAKWWDLSEEFQVNNHVLLPGKPKFQPTSPRFSWNDVRLTREECGSCRFINSNRPEGMPTLPCLEVPYFDRCVSCISTNSLSICRLHDKGHQSRNDDLQVPQWNRGQRGGTVWQTPHQRWYAQDRAPSSTYAHRPSRDPERWSKDQKRTPVHRRNSRDEGLARESSPVRNGDKQMAREHYPVYQEGSRSRMERLSETPVYEAPTQNATPSRSTAGTSGTSRVSKDVTVEETTNTLKANDDNIKQSTRPDVVQASYMHTFGSMTSGSPSTFAMTPSSTMPADPISSLRKVLDDNLQLKMENEALNELFDELQMRYNRTNEKVERLTDENEKLVQETTRLKDTFREALLKIMAD